jgi:hypothetical protein
MITDFEGDFLLREFGHTYPFRIYDTSRTDIGHKGSVKNNLVEFAPEFAVDLIDLIEQDRRNSELFQGFLRLKIG